MTFLSRLFGRGRIYDDLSEEIRAHLDEHVEALMAKGMSHADATAQARRAFGNVTALQERGREVWEWPTIESFLMDLRFAMRQLRRTPALATIVLLTLAVGIAATTTVFSWTRTILLDPLPGAGDAQQVRILESVTASGSWTPVSWLDYRDFRRYLKSFSGLAAAYPTSVAVGDGNAERRWGELVSANFFDVLRVRPALGHFFTPSGEGIESDAPDVVISYDFWRATYHGDSSVIGTVADVNRFPFRIVGVAPAGFHGSMPGEAIDVWVPASLVSKIFPTGGSMLHDRDWRSFRVLARLAPGVLPDVAAGDVQRFGTFMSNTNGGRSTGMSAMLLPVWKSHYGMQDALRAPLIVLLGACGLVLLIVCANMANLLLARATGRRRELGLRVALGAPRRRLVRQLLTEASLLAVAGSALGFIITIWLSRSLHLLVPSFAAPSLLDSRVDGGVLAFVAALAIGVTLVAGIAPALHGSRTDLKDALNDGRGAVGGSRQSTRLRNLLVIGEMALAVVSLVGAGLFYRSFNRTRDVSPGFDRDHVAIASVSLTLAGFDSARGDAFLDRVARRLHDQPGVASVAYADYVPLSLGSGSWEDLQVEGYAPQLHENLKVPRAAIGPDYFKTLGIALTQGRDFRADDDSAHTPVMVVNEAFVKHFLANRPVLGVRVHGWGKWFTIVGVAADSKTYRLTDPARPYFYVAIRQVYRPEYGYTFLVRSQGAPDQYVRAISDAVKAEDPAIPVFNAMTLAQYIDGPMQGQHAAVRLLALLAGIALFLAAIGLYGVVAYAVAQRTKEMGVRIALGAQPTDLIRSVASSAGALVAVGLAAGIVGALAMGRLVGSLLYAVGGADPLVIVAAAGGMVAIAALATAVPARRAMKVDPIIALRAD